LLLHNIGTFHGYTQKSFFYKKIITSNLFTLVCVLILHGSYNSSTKYVLARDFNIFVSSGRNSPTETKSEKSSLTQLTGMSSSTAGTALAAKMAEAGGMKKRSPEAFMSIQLEKVGFVGVVYDG